MDELATFRRHRGGPVAGICGALGERLGIDPVLLRVALGLLSLSGGLGFLLYGAAWLITPLQDEDERPLQRLVPRARSLDLRGLLILVGSLTALLFIIISSLTGFSNLGFLGVLAVGWYWYRKQRSDKPSASQPSSVPPPALPSTQAFLTAAYVWRLRMDEVARAADIAETQVLRQPDRPGPPKAPAAPSAPLPQQPPAPRPQARPEPTVLLPVEPTQPLAVPAAAPLARKARAPRWLSLGTPFAMVAALTAVSMADSAGTVDGSAYLGAALGVAALALVASAFVRRPRYLLPVTLLLTLITIASLAPTTPTKPDQTLTYATLAELPAEPVHMGVGSMVVDLSALDVTRDASLEIDHGVGDMTVILPKDEAVRVVWRVKVGSYHGPDRQVDGLDTSGTYAQHVTDQGHTLVVTITQSTGNLEVTTR